MKILPIQKYNINLKKDVKYQTSSDKNAVQSSYTSIPLGYKYNLPVFSGLKIEDKFVKKVLNREFIGKNIFTKNNYIDYSKIGMDKLAKEDLDVTKATDNEITAYRYSLALAESYECSWVKRFNPFNRRYSLATLHSLNSEKVNKNYYAKCLDILSSKNRCKSLDVPIVHRDGSLALNGVVLDTETTGTNPSVDKIIQLASIQIKDGKTDKSGIYNKLINPETHIPEGASAVNGITDSMVKDSPTIVGVLKDYLGNYLKKENGIIIAYNHKFDIPILNRSIREYNIASKVSEKEKQMFKVLDPYLLIQRIHPFLGARKNLSKQYQWLFCKSMENAHDALADVKGTIDVLKYCLYYIEKHHSKAGKNYPITLREVLAFQFGSHNVKNIDIPLHPTKNFNSNVEFSASYKYVPLNVDNYFKSYKLTANVAERLESKIGAKNIDKLRDNGIIG
nr:3'-5' exonuclease [bacterium]